MATADPPESRIAADVNAGPTPTPVHPFAPQASSLFESRVLEAVLRGVNDGIVTRDPIGRVIHANRTAARLLGFDSVGDLLAAAPAAIQERFNVYDESGTLIPHDSVPSTLVLQGIQVAPSVVRFRHLQTGEERWVMLNTVPVRGERGDIEFVVSVLSDITERRAAEEALRASEARFQAFMDNSPVVAFVKDEAGRFVYVSRPFARLFGTTPEQMEGSPDSTLVTGEVLRRIHEDDREVLATGRLKEVIELVPTPDGAARYWLTFKFPVPVPSGRTFVGGASVEVTERLQAEEALQQYAQRLETMSRQLIKAQEGERKRIARELHDQVGQALTAIKIDLQIAQHRAAEASRAETPLTPDQQAAPLLPLFSERLGQSIDMVERTIQQVREASLNLRPSILDDLGLPSALLWYTEEQARRAGFQAELAIEQLEKRLPAELEIICFRIAQEAITNIVRHAEAGHVRVELRRSDGGLLLVVTDDGTGFDPKSLDGDRANRPAGSEDAAMIRGLGLAGMHERVLLVGGSLAIESALRRGTTVRATFPLSAFSPTMNAAHR